MNRVNINKLLERAEGQFSIGDYMGSSSYIWEYFLDEVFPRRS